MYPMISPLTVSRRLLYDLYSQFYKYVDRHFDTFDRCQSVHYHVDRLEGAYFYFDYNVKLYFTMLPFDSPWIYQYVYLISDK